MELVRTRYMAVIVLLILISLPVSGDWTSFRGDERNSGTSDLDIWDVGSRSLQVLWETRGDAAIQMAVVGNEDRVIFNTLNGSIYVLDTNTGAFVYKRQVSGPLYNSPVIFGDVFIVATGSGEVISYLMENGVKLWNTTLGDGDQIRSSPKIKDGSVLISSYDSNVYSLNAENGELEWTFTGCGGQIHTTVTFYQGNDLDLVIFGSCDGNLYAIDRGSGALVWNFTAEYIPSSPVIVDDLVYFGSFDGSITCLDVLNGRSKWSTPLSSSIYSSASADGEVLCVGTDEGKFYLLDSVNGDIIWEVNISQGSIKTSPVLVKKHVLITSGNGLQILSRKNGSIVRGFEHGDSSDSSPSVIDGLIFFGDSNGYVRAIGIDEKETVDPLDIGIEDDPGRDLLTLIIGSFLIIGIGIILYIGYLKIRRSE